jgi:outer membrane protein assembly factor BamB
LVFATSPSGGLGLFAVRPDGHGDVTATHLAWKRTRNVPSRSSQILAGDHIFMISDTGMISCIDAKSGADVWQQRVDGAFSASPLFAEGRIYFFGEGGEVPVVAAEGECRLLATNRLGDGFMASPAVYGNSLVLRSRSLLYRIE